MFSKSSKNEAITSFDELEKFTGVTALGANNNVNSAPFANCTNLKSIKLHENIEYIYQSSFNMCTSLIIERLKLPKLKTLQSSSFYGCKIRRINDLGKITYVGGSNNIYSGAFGQCVELTESVLPETITEIAGNAFYACINLSEINFPNALKTIGQNAFYNCTSLAIEDLSLPNLETLGQNAFYGVSIKKISNLGKITTLPSASASTQLFGKKDVLEEIVLPETVTDIPVYSFVDYTALSKYNLSHVKTINNSAFKNTPYKDVVDLSSIVSLTGSAINGTNWGKIIIGENCTTIDQYNFWQFKSTPILIVRSVTPPSLAANNNMNFCSVIYVPDASVETYKQATNWSAYADRILPLSEYTE